MRAMMLSAWQTSVRVVALTALLSALVCPGVAYAQRARIGGPPRVDVSVGGGLVTGMALASRDAVLRANNPAPQPFTLFSTTTTVSPSPVFEVRVAGALGARLAVEGQAAIGRPEFRTSVTGDAESPADVTVAARVTSLMLGGGVRVGLSAPGRTMPHVSAGAGVFRYAHEGRVVGDTSPLVYAGGGLRHAFSRAAGGAGRAGLRFDVQVLLMSDGLRVDGGLTPRVSATGGVFVAF